MADFDAIVVGAGCAGSVAAYELAKAGKEVLLIERGNFAGAKNMTGGRIYAHSLRKVFPDFESEAPLERKITRERISLMDAGGADLAVDFTRPRPCAQEDKRLLLGAARALRPVARRARPRTAGAEYHLRHSPSRSSSRTRRGKIVRRARRRGRDQRRGGRSSADGVNSLLCRGCRRLRHARRRPRWPSASRRSSMLAEQTVSDRLLCARRRGRRAGCSSATATHGDVGRRLPVHEQGVHLPGQWWPASTACASGKRRTRLPDARGLQEPSGRGAPDSWRQGGGALRTHGARGRRQHDATADGRWRHARGRQRHDVHQPRLLWCAAWTTPLPPGNWRGRQAARAIDSGDTSKAGLTGLCRCPRDPPSSWRICA